MKTCRNKRLSGTFCFQALLCLSFLETFYFSAAAHAKSSDPGNFSALHESYLLSMQIHELEYRLANYGAQILYVEDDKKISNNEKLEILFDALALIQQKNHEEHLLAQQTSIHSFVHGARREEYLIACEGMGGGIGGLRGPALPCFGGPALSPLENIPDRPLKTGSILPSGVTGTVGSAAIIGAGILATDHVSDAYHISQIDNLIHKALDIKQDSSISDEEKKEKVNILISDAIDHNSKISRRRKSNEKAIRNLDVEKLRSSRF